MDVKVLVFGQIRDYTGWDEKTFSNIPDTENLKNLLETEYPGLKKLQYQMALNHSLIAMSTTLHNLDEIALLPPFSGG